MLLPAFGWDTQEKSLIMNRCFTHAKADADDKSGVDAGPNNAE